MFRREECATESVAAGCQPEADIGRPAACRENFYSFFLFPGFSLLTLAAFLEPLKLANQTLNRTAYRWKLIGCDGMPVQSSCGISLPVDVDIERMKRQVFQGYRLDYVFLVGGKGSIGHSTQGTKAFLRFLNRRGIGLGGLGAGSWLIADAGLLQQKRCTIHWQELASFAETHPEAQVEDNLFVRDGSIHSCPGEFASFDMATSLVRDEFGDVLAGQICDQLLADRYRSSTDRQRIPLRSRFGPVDEKLLAAARIMERTIERPIPLRRIAKGGGLSPRHMERLFHKYIGCTPGSYYLGLRLERAQQLLQKTRMPIIDVALSCGFETGSYFSKCFRDRFGVSPTQMRG